MIFNANFIKCSLQPLAFNAVTLAYVIKCIWHANNNMPIAYITRVIWHTVTIIITICQWH